MKTSKFEAYSQAQPCILDPQTKFLHQTAWGPTESCPTEVLVSTGT